MNDIYFCRYGFISSNEKDFFFHFDEIIGDTSLIRERDGVEFQLKARRGNFNLFTILPL